MSASGVASEATALHVHESELQNTPEEVIPCTIELNKVYYTEERKKSLQARYYFGIIFLMMNLVAWFFRDYGQSVIPWVHYIKVCGNEGEDCFHSLGVLRVKLLELVQEFFFCVVHFITWWSQYWTPDEENKQRCSLGLFLSTLFYVASICGVVYMYRSYASRSSCSLNLFFITWTTILLAVMMVVSLHPKVNRGLLSSGIMASYIVFLCWCAIRSEPAAIRCEIHNQEKGYGGWITILGFLIAIFAIVMAALSTGIDTKCFQFSKNKVEQEDVVPYNYGFFHMVFSLGAMYFAMLFISWDLNNSARKWSIDVGWASTWAKVINEWFAATIYLWMLISPVVRQNKVMDSDGIAQEIVDSAMV